MTALTPAEARFQPNFGLGIYLFTWILVGLNFLPNSIFFARMTHAGRQLYLSLVWAGFNKALASLFGVRRVYYFWLIYFSVMEVIAVVFWMGGWRGG